MRGQPPARPDFTAPTQDSNPGARPRTPVTLVSGPLGSGKTTLLLHVLEQTNVKVALIMNEFGEIGIDGRILSGRNVEIAELDGGCVCCSLLGEFEAAVDEILEAAEPDWIVVETTGVAEPDALAFDIQESLPQLRLDGVVVVMDADAMVAFPSIGHTTRLQAQAADTILLNKVDLVEPEALPQLKQQLRELNPRAEIIISRHCKVDTVLLMGLTCERKIEPPQSRHQSEYQALVLHPPAILQRACFEQLVSHLTPAVYRAKGFVTLEKGSYLFNFVAGRWGLEPFEPVKPVLVFIGRNLADQSNWISRELNQCRLENR